MVANWHDALDQCEIILELIDNDVPDRAWDKSPDFFESIHEKVVDISEWVEDKEHITKNMADSLNNMEQGVRKWIGD